MVPFYRKRNGDIEQDEMIHPSSKPYNQQQKVGFMVTRKYTAFHCIHIPKCGEWQYVAVTNYSIYLAEVPDQTVPAVFSLQPFLWSFFVLFCHLQKNSKFKEQNNSNGACPTVYSIGKVRQAWIHRSERGHWAHPSALRHPSSIPDRCWSKEFLKNSVQVIPQPPQVAFPSI